MKTYLKALVFVVALGCIGAGIGIGIFEWMVFVSKLGLTNAMSFLVSVGPILLLAAIPVARASAMKGRKH